MTFKKLVKEFEKLECKLTWEKSTRTYKLYSSHAGITFYRYSRAEVENDLDNIARFRRI
jgi:hypothetical protein